MGFPTTAFAATMFFQDNQNSLGWSETYYRDSVDIAAALTAANSLAALRAAIMVNTYTLIATRVSGVPTPLGDSLTNGVAITGSLDATTRIPCEPWTALMMKLESGSTKRGRKFLHGVPRDFFLGSRVYDATNASNAAVVSFMTALNNVAWGIRVNAAVLPVVSYEYRRITNAIPQRQVEHKVGRPFGLLRGRR